MKVRSNATTPSTANPIVDRSTWVHSSKVRLGSSRPVNLSSSSLFPHWTIRSADNDQTAIRKAQTTLAMPVHASSCLVFWTATLMITLASKSMDATAERIRAALDGAAKNRRVTINVDRAILE